MIVNLPGSVVVDHEKACLLGSPICIGNVSSFDSAIEDKIHTLRTKGDCFPHLAAHDSLTLLRHSFAIPKLRYLLRTAPCFLSDQLEEYDSSLRSILSTATNTPLVHNDTSNPASSTWWLGSESSYTVGPISLPVINCGNSRLGFSNPTNIPQDPANPLY